MEQTSVTAICLFFFFFNLLSVSVTVVLLMLSDLFVLWLCEQAISAKCLFTPVFWEAGLIPQTHSWQIDGNTAIETKCLPVALLSSLIQWLKPRMFWWFQMPVKSLWQIKVKIAFNRVLIISGLTGLEFQYFYASWFSVIYLSLVWFKRFSFVGFVFKARWLTKNTTSQNNNAGWRVFPVYWGI